MSLSVQCLECGAVNFTTAKKCYLCGKELTPPRPGALPPPLPQPTRGPWTYSLSTLFLIVTLAGVCFGLIAAAPGLGILISVLVAPALVRTFAISRVHRAKGEKLSTEQKIGGFLMSLAIMIAIVVAAAAAIVAAVAAICFSLQNSRSMSGDAQLTLALGVGGTLALIVSIWIFIRTWPRRRK